MRNLTIISISLATLTFVGCSTDVNKSLTYTDYGVISSIKCESNNVCSIETEHTLAIVPSSFLPISPSTNDHLYKVSYNTPLKARDMWCVNDSCKPNDVCNSIIGSC